MENETLPLEILLHIFGFIGIFCRQPSPGSKTRLSVLCTSKDIRNACLQHVWKPWENHGIGLKRAVAKGYVGYFRRWFTHSPDSRWLFFSNCEESILVTAATNGFLDFVKMFTRGSLGVKNGPLDPSLNRWLPFRRACAMQRINVVRYFLKTYEIEENAGLESLVFACRNGHYKTAKVLLEDGEFDPSSDDSYCLKKACKYGHTKIVELLLDDGRADPNAGEGAPIFYAYRKNDPEMYEALCIDYRTIIPKWLIKADPEGWWTNNENSEREETESS